MKLTQSNFLSDTQTNELINLLSNPTDLWIINLGHGCNPSLNHLSNLSEIYLFFYLHLQSSEFQ